MGPFVPLEVGTLSLVVEAVCIVLALLLLYVRRSLPRYRGVGRWALGMLLFAAAASLIPWRGPLSSLLGTVLARTLVVAGAAAVADGIWAFAGTGRRLGWIAYLPIPLTAAGLAIFSFIVENGAARDAILYGTLAFHCGAAALILMQGDRRSSAWSLRVAGAVCSVMAVLSLVRIVLSAGGSGASDGAFLRPLSILLFGVSVVALTFSLLFASLVRLAEELASHEQEAARRESDRLVETIIDNLPQSIVLKDKDLRYLSCNAAFARYFGKKPDAFRGLDDYDLYPRDLAAKYRSDDTAVLRSGETSEFIERYPSPGGERWVDALKTPLKNEQGATIGVLSIFRDVTDRLRSESALKERELKYRELSQELERSVEERTRKVSETQRDLELFFELSTDYLCLFDLQGRFLRASPSWTKGLGYREEELIGRSLFDFVPQEDRSAVEGVFSSLTNGGKLRQSRNRAVRADGAIIWLSWDSVGVPDRGLIIAVAHDVTAQVEAAARLEEAKQEAERTSKSKSLFISAMSHELRTPLNAVLGYARLADQLVQDDKARSYLASILSAGSSLLDIINDLLDLTKLESGRLELVPAPFDPRDLIDDARQVFAIDARDKGIALDFEAEAALPGSVLADRARLRQVVLNLVGNAVKFTERGSVRLRIASRPDEAEAAGADEEPAGSGGPGGASGRPGMAGSDGETMESGERKIRKARFTIRVEDTGIGMSEEYRRRLFEPFSQQDDDIMRRYGGTGLGLAIAKRLLDLMGGTLSCESEQGVGTRFTVEIPSLSVSD